MRFLSLFTTFFIVAISLCALARSKYIEGTLRTIENWAFVTRFCFLSERGEYEYHIEYNEDQGEINLLLYYDTEDQWPAVYKTNKTCREKEAALKLEQNQVINLTTKYPYREISGCYFAPNEWTPAPKQPTISIPTVPTRRTTTRKRVTTTTETTSTSSVEETATTPTFSNSSLALTEQETEVFNATTEDANMQFEGIFENLEDLSYDSNESVSMTTPDAPIRKRWADPFVPPHRARKGNRKIICHHSRRFRSSRERWWFVAVSNCNGTRGIDIKYKILMVNGPSDDYWHHHFSADEFYILPVLMTSTIAYSFLLLAIIICSVELKSRQLLHSSYKLYVFSVLLEFFGILFQAMAYLKYAINGLGFPAAKTLGSMFTAASETCFLLLLLLLAKGYTVTRGRLPVAASIKITVFMCLYVVTYLSLFIYETKVFDPGEVLYLYESPAGYGLIILRVFAWCMFIYSTIFTLKHYPEKANFYYPFNIFGTLWFIAGPAFILSANSYIDKWVRESIVCGVLLLIAFSGHLIFLILTMPSVANKNFPYHVRTTQIGIMEVAGAMGASTMDQFGHNVYEPSAAMTETVIIPLTRRTEEIFETMYAQRQTNGLLAPPSAVETRDTALENVLNWSLARNPPALAPFETANRNGSLLGSARSRSSDRSAASSRRPSFNFETAAPQYNFEDYVRDVPVELFTVSKMVISTTNLKVVDSENDCCEERNVAS